MFTEIYGKPQQLATEAQPYLFYVYLLSFQSSSVIKSGVEDDKRGRLSL